MKLNKIMAFSMAAAMVVTGPAAAFASSTANPTVEYNGATDADYNAVVLDTTPTNAEYTFTLDPSGLIAKYDSTVTKSTVYFDGVEKTAATLTNKNAETDGKIYLRTIKSGGQLKNVVTTEDGKTLAIDDDKLEAGGVDYYVWVPDKETGNNAGKYEKITSDNINRYFTGTYKENSDGSYTVTAVAVNKDNLRFEYKDGDTSKPVQAVCDGNIYVDTFTALTGKEDLTQYGTIAKSGEVTTFTPKAAVDGKTDLYVMLKADKSYESLTDAFSSDGEEYILTPATTGYSDKSKTYTVTNKSTYDLDIAVEVSITNIGKLPLATDGKFSTSSPEAAYLSFTDGKNVFYAKHVDANGKKVGDSGAGDYAKTVINAEYVLGAVDTSNAITYQDQKPSNNNILGHEYKKYFANGASYNNSTFYMTGATNAKYTDWAAFVNGYASTATNQTAKPEISVVYKISALKAKIADDKKKVTATIPTATNSKNIKSVTLDGSAVASSAYAFVDATGAFTYTVPDSKTIEGTTHTFVITTDKGKYTFKTHETNSSAASNTLKTDKVNKLENGTAVSYVDPE